MAKKNREFVFEGTSATKFRTAGQNHVLNGIRPKRDVQTLIQYVENNYISVCNCGGSKGFCFIPCKDCPVQQAYNTAMKELAGRSPAIVVNINNCNNFSVNIPPKQRLGKSWEEMRKEMKKQ